MSDKTKSAMNCHFGRQFAAHTKTAAEVPDTQYNMLQHNILSAKTCTSFQNDCGVQLPSMLAAAAEQKSYNAAAAASAWTGVRFALVYDRTMC